MWSDTDLFCWFLQAGTGTYPVKWSSISSVQTGFFRCVISWPKEKKKGKGNQLVKLTRLDGGLSGLVRSIDLFCFLWQPVALSLWGAIYLSLLPPDASQPAWSPLPPQQGQKKSIEWDKEREITLHLLPWAKHSWLCKRIWFTKK